MARPLNVLIGCEESGVVREAFRALGHRAWSCDLRPARDGSPHHLQMDVREALTYGTSSPSVQPWWDLGIFHPPCTYLCNSGVRWFTTVPAIQKPGVLYGDARVVALREAVDLFAAIYNCDIPKIAIENPVMHNRARDLLRVEHGVPTWDQTVQPWHFGHEEFKRTCLWLRGLDPLQPTNDLSREWGLPRAGTPEHKRWSQVHRASPGEHRARDRSVTYPGIAEAMAWQWGGDARGGE